eukprot:9862543-Alexandrium_andersonii.AAC.1
MAAARPVVGSRLPRAWLAGPSIPWLGSPIVAHVLCAGWASLAPSTSWPGAPLFGLSSASLALARPQRLSLGSVGPRST